MSQKFLDLAKQMEDLATQTEAVRAELNAEMAAMGVGTMIQDPTTSLVYKIVEPKGTFIYFKKIDYIRTAKEGEKGGTVLAKKDAEAAGYRLSK